MKTWGLLLIGAAIAVPSIGGIILMTFIGAAYCLVESYRNRLDEFTAGHLGAVMSTPLLLVGFIGLLQNFAFYTVVVGALLLVFTVFGFVLLYATYAEVGEEIRKDAKGERR